MANKDLIAERLKQLNENKDTLKHDKPNVMESIATGKGEKIDFMAMAEKLEEKNKNEYGHLNENYTKDTIYIRSDLHKAFNALCTKQGDKKRRTNEMMEEYLTREYKKLGKELDIDI